jgi:hypothetical protein
MCQLAGQQQLSKHAAAVLTIPCMPLQLTQLLLQAGLQPTTAQLVAAARAQLEGLDGWLVRLDNAQPGSAQAAAKGVMVSGTSLMPWSVESTAYFKHPGGRMASHVQQC